MNTPSRSTETGQAIVLLALALVGILGFAALAIDGGTIYTEQRRAQAAADNGVIAAAYALMITKTSTYTDLQTAAMGMANANGFTNTQTTQWVTFYNPPISGANVGNKEYVQMFITETVPTALAHFVYQGPWYVTVNAEARVPKNTVAPPYSGSAIVSTNKSDCQTMQFGGSSQTQIIGAGVFANGGNCTGGNKVSSVVVQDGSGGVSFVNGNLQSSGAIYSTTNGVTSNLTPTTLANQTAPEAPTIDPPSGVCGVERDKTSYTVYPTGTVFLPGTYSNGILDNVEPGKSATTRIILSKGIYCLGGSLNTNMPVSTDTNQNGIQDFASGNSTEGVLIYFYNPPADNSTTDVFNSNGNATNVLWAMQEGSSTSSSYTSWSGMIMFVKDVTNSSDPCGNIKINGGAGNQFVGTIYAPCSIVDINGGSGTFALTTQVIAYKANISGNGGVTIVYNPDLLYMIPADPSVALVR